MTYIDDIHENAKEYVFYTSINKQPVKVKLDVGWIWFEKDDGYTGPFGIMGKRKIIRHSLTTEDAKKLADCIYKLLGIEK